MTTPIIPRARAEIHEKVVEIVKSLGPAEGKAALDAPLGFGHMATQLEQSGYAVTGLDMDLKQSDGVSPSIKRQLGNFNLPLPLPEAAFDLVMTSASRASSTWKIIS